MNDSEKKDVVWDYKEAISCDILICIILRI